jgi:predicted flap endonuclease-1-like 5' DNA nuclease
MMTIMEERAPGAQEERQPARVPVRRPASGIVIDPKRLIAWRSRRALSRAELAARISALGWADEETGKPVRYMREFALAHGFRYKDPDSGRVYYPRRLREAYAQHVLDLAIRDSDGQDPPDGEIVRLARQDLRQPEPEPEPAAPARDPAALEPLARPEDLPDPELPVPDLGLSARARNCLLREGITTAGQLAARSRADLADIRDLGPRGRDEIIAKIAELTAAGAGPGEQLAS